MMHPYFSNGHVRSDESILVIWFLVFGKRFPSYLVNFLVMLVCPFLVTADAKALRDMRKRVGWDSLHGVHVRPKIGLQRVLEFAILQP